MIHIACVDITSIGEQEYLQLYAQASPARRQRADRCLRQEDKIRCVAAHALIRYAVAQELKLTDFTVEQEAFGKPYIPGRPDFHFNLSHSGHWVVIAYGDSPVGIDVQEIRTDAKKESIARRNFTPEEQAYLFDAKADEQEKRFFQIWTAKESYLKYLGTGLRQPLDSFCVVPDGSALGVRLTSTFWDGYVLSLCTQAEHTNVIPLTPEQFTK